MSLVLRFHLSWIVHHLYLVTDILKWKAARCGHAYCSLDSGLPTMAFKVSKSCKLSFNNQLKIITLQLQCTLHFSVLNFQLSCRNKEERQHTHIHTQNNTVCLEAYSWKDVGRVVTSWLTKFTKKKWQYHWVKKSTTRIATQTATFHTTIHT